MARPLRIQYPGAYYHVTCRGNQRGNIFFDPKDHRIFLDKLSVSLEIYNIELLTYVLMPNHFHLLVTTPDANLSEFMRHFNITYTSVFNRRHQRVGHLYQGRYKAFLIDADNYLLEVSRYIHLNPVRTKQYTKKNITEKWHLLLNHEASSLVGYLEEGQKKNFVNYRNILDYMGGESKKGRETYRRFLASGLAQNQDNPLDVGKGSGIVGNSNFVEWIKSNFLLKEVSHREQPALRELRKLFTPKKVIRFVAAQSGISEEEICRRGKNSNARALLMEMLYRFCYLTQPEIGSIVGGIDYSAVSQTRKRLQIRLKHEPKLNKKFLELQGRLEQLAKQPK
jgi:REP element-mobilizing transposase RayT